VGRHRLPRDEGRWAIAPPATVRMFAGRSSTSAVEMLRRGEGDASSTTVGLVRSMQIRMEREATALSEDAVRVLEHNCARVCEKLLEAAAQCESRATELERQLREAQAQWAKLDQEAQAELDHELERADETLRGQEEVLPEDHCARIDELALERDCARLGDMATLAVRHVRERLTVLGE
jgi:Asp-tRNA(Asn)/Glu-tRNA(Gln) amidotransferase A subunit family amidase